MNVKYAFIAGERGPSATASRREELAALVAWSFEQSEGTYGYRRVHADLAGRGVYADDDTIRRIVRDLGLVPCQPRPKRPTTTQAGDAAAAPHLLGRDFTAGTPGTKLVGFITYVKTREGCLYLATVLDCIKQILGYAMADHLRTSLVTDALTMAAANTTMRAGVTVSHSDRGCQYTSPQFADFTDRHGLRRYLGRTGTCSIKPGKNRSTAP